MYSVPRPLYVAYVTPEEAKAIAWGDARGYTGDLMRHAHVRNREYLSPEEVEIYFPDKEMDRRLLALFFLSEAEAWNWLDDIDEHCFLTCMAPPLAQKIQTLRDSIV